MSPLIRPTIVRWWCGWSKTSANIALLDFMLLFHGVKTCRLQTLQSLWPRNAHWIIIIVWLTRNLEIWIVKKKRDTQHPHNGSAKVKMMAARFLGDSRVGQCQQWQVGLLMCFTTISIRCQLTNLSTWSLHYVIKLSNWSFNKNYHLSPFYPTWSIPFLPCHQSVLPLRSTLSQVPHRSKVPSGPAMEGRTAWVQRYRALPAKW